MPPLATRGHQTGSTGGLPPSWKSRGQEGIGVFRREPADLMYLDGSVKSKSNGCLGT